MLLLWNALGVPSTRVPIGLSASASYILPPVVCSFGVAVLVLMKSTRTARVALWLILALLALRAVASVDISLGKPGRTFAHASFVAGMFAITARALDLALEKESLVRYLRPEKSSPSIIMDAFDLTTNMRGYGWNWSNRLYVPPETRPKNRIAFVLCTLLSAVVHTIVCGVSCEALQSVACLRSSVKGSAVFDETLPLFLRYLRAGIMTALMGIMAYAHMQMNYDLGTIVGVVFVRQDPAQWPPLFDAPWRATSLADFWGRRWHQLHRRNFLFLGGYPLSALLGPTGIVLGAFLASAVLHDMLLAAIDNTSETWRMFAAFGMMAPGILAERAFYRLTGKRVGGIAGWVWTMAWLLMWNSLMLDGLMRAGMSMMCNSSFFDGVVPLRALVERVVKNVGYSP